MGRHLHSRRRPARAQLLTTPPVVVAWGLVPLFCLSLSVPALHDLDSKGRSRADLTPQRTTAHPIPTGTSPHDEQALGTEVVRLDFRNDTPYIHFPFLAIMFAALTRLSPQDAAEWLCANLPIPLCATVNAALLQCRERSTLWPSTVVVSLLAVGSHCGLKTYTVPGSAAGPLSA